MTALFSVLALISFAANSILCRLALRSHSIDPASFTSIRLLSGAMVLGLIVLASGKSVRKAGNWISACALFLYAIAFSFAYIKLSAGLGALMLFGSVQATMIIASIIAKRNPTVWQWIGLLLAIGGLTWLVLPGILSSPENGEHKQLFQAALMALAGMSWGIYSVRGSMGADAVAATTGNFLRATPFLVIPIALFVKNLDASSHGVMWAVLSGAVTSGLGYVFWYAALPGLGAIRGAVVQLAVPVLVACGGILLLGEHMTSQLAVSMVVILGGVALALLGKRAKL